MLFDDVIAEHRRAIGAFLADPTRTTMQLRVDPDLEMVAGRFLALFGNDEERDAGDQPLAFGVSGDLVDPEAFYRDAAAQIGESVAPLLAEYQPEDPDLRLPDGLQSGGWPPGCCIEARFAEYLESIARGIAGWHETVVLAMRFDALDVRAATLSLQRLGGYLTYPGVKLVVFDDRQNPRLPPLRSVRTRYTADAYQPAQSDPEGRLTRFLASDDKRVLGLWVQDRNVRHLWDTLKSLRTRGVPVKPLFVEEAFESPTRFANRVYRRIATGKRTHPNWVTKELTTIAELGLEWPSTGDLPENVHDLRSLDRPESTFTELVERASAKQDGEVPCVVLRPTAVYDREAWPGFVRDLANAAVSADVKYIVLDVDGSAPLPEAPPEEVPWSMHTFTMGAQDMHASLELSLKKPDLPIDLRMKHLVMLANVRSAQGRHTEAAELAAEGIELAEKQHDRQQVVTGWWTLGYALQRSGNYEYSRNAFAESTNAALDDDNIVGAANALMGLGNTWYLEKNWVDAIKTYEVARAHWVNAGQVFGECQALIWIGESYRKAKLFDEAEKRFLEVIQRYQAMKAPFEQMAKGGLADVLERLAANYQEAGRRPLAEECRKRAREQGSHGPVPDRPG